MTGAVERPPLVAVCGTSRSDDATDELAERVGGLITARGGIVVCGGLGGVMAAVARGVRRANGFSVGLLPGDEASDATPDVSLAIPTGLGEGRNLLIVRACAVVIAIGGAYGTLSEIALALRLGKRVIGLSTWSIQPPGGHIDDPAILRASSADEAVRLAFEAIEGRPILA
ncbi:MAG: TIGR00725 family protein [Candidatus Dormibacteria bacterium]